MRNQKGITLIELLAALAIGGIIIVVIASVLSTGTSSANRTSSKQQVQQEANIIVEKIRNNYLKNISPGANETILDNGCTEREQIVLTISSDKKSLLMNGEIISEGFEYSDLISEPLCRKNPSKFKLTIKKGEAFYPISTTFSKLN